MVKTYRLLELDWLELRLLVDYGSRIHLTQTPANMQANSNMSVGVQ